MTLPIPVSLTAWLWALVLLVLLPLGLLAFALHGPVGPAPGGPSPTLAIAAYLLVGVIGFALLASLRRAGVELASGRLTLRGSLYTRRIALEDIDRSSITLHDGKPPLALRTNGIGLPGYGAGWFRTRQGERAFVVYGGGPCLSFRSRDGVLHVIGAADAAALKAALAT